MDLPIRHLTIEDSETINACLCLVYTILHGEDKVIESNDKRVTKERLIETIGKLMPDLEF